MRQTQERCPALINATRLERVCPIEPATGWPGLAAEHKATLCHKEGQLRRPKTPPQRLGICVLRVTEKRFRGGPLTAAARSRTGLSHGGHERPTCGGPDSTAVTGVSGRPRWSPFGD